MSPHVVSFRFSYRVGGAMVFRPVSHLVLSSRVGVPFVSCGLAFSCRRFACRVGVGVSLLISFLVSCCRLVLSGVSCRCRPVAPFLSARVLVSSRLFSPLLLFSVCSSRRVCRMALGRCGVAVRGCRGAGDMGVAWRYVMRGGVAWCRAVR